MKPVFEQVESLDKRCCDKFLLTQDILMENASGAMRDFIQKKFIQKSKILIVCGGGNNGADGIALARQLHKNYKIHLFLTSKNLSSMADKQLKRANAINVKIITSIKNNYDVIVDCIFGSGLNKPLSENINSLINKLNKKSGFKISCDIPSGIYSDKNKSTNEQKNIFKADTTITMGALKTSLFSDGAKDAVGKIKVANLGISQKIYKQNTNMFVLQKSDLKLPFRNKNNTHKGSFGHSCVIAGEREDSKIGACIIALRAAMSFGSGLCTLIHDKPINEYEIVIDKSIPKNCNAIAVGMGLGNMPKAEFKKLTQHIINNNISCVLDADVFYRDDIIALLKYKNSVLTPHPKEFVSLLKITKIANISIEKLVNNRIFYIKQFVKKYPNTTLLLKGANTVIANKYELYIQPLGAPALSKGGMGDVLSGLIVSLLAQGYPCIKSAINASLAHSLSAKQYKKNNYSLNPLNLIKQIKKLK